MKVGYVRVSTIEQNEERQIVELRKNGVEKFFVDKVSAKSAQRPKFDEMMNFFREGDELIVTEFSRLARSTVDLLNIVETLTKQDVKVRSLKEQVGFSTPQGKSKLQIFQNLLFAIRYFLNSNSFDVGEKIIQAKILHPNFSAEELEKIVGLSHTTISKYLLAFRDKFHSF